MSKRSPSKQISRRSIYIGSGIGLVVIVLIGFFALRSNTPAAQDISPATYQSQFVASNTPHLLLDVRTPDEFASGHIHGAVNIPLDSLEGHLSEVPKDEAVIVYCHSGNRSAQASRILAQAGYTTIYDLGGINDWESQGFPVE